MGRKDQGKERGSQKKTAKLSLLEKRKQTQEKRMQRDSVKY